MLLTAQPARELARAEQLVKFMHHDEVLKNMMHASNEQSVKAAQVYHGWEHALEVYALVYFIARQINKFIFLKIVTRFDLAVALAAALLHDIGRSEDVGRHHEIGAAMAEQYLKDTAVVLWGDASLIPAQFLEAVLYAVRYHGANVWLYQNGVEKLLRQREIPAVWMALLLLADKLCGSEVRVPDAKMQLMRWLATLPVEQFLQAYPMLDPDWTLARLFWNAPVPECCSHERHYEMLLQGAIAYLQQHGHTVPALRSDAHDHVNGAIRERRIQIVPNKNGGRFQGTLIWHLQVDVRIANLALVTSLDWWKAAIHSAAKAAKSLDLQFLMIFNGVALMYDKRLQAWAPAPTFHAISAHG